MAGSLHDAGTTTTKKRAAPVLNPADIVQAHDWSRYVQNGTLSKQTAATLQAYCKFHGLPHAGKKADLQARVETHVLGVKSQP